METLWVVAVENIEATKNLTIAKWGENDEVLHVALTLAQQSVFLIAVEALKVKVVCRQNLYIGIVPFKHSLP